MRPVGDDYLSRWCQPHSAACAAAKLLQSAGGPSISIADNWQSFASTKQMDNGTVREKEAKSGRARTFALPSLAVEELRRWRFVQAQELLRLGIRADEDWLVVT